MIVIGAELAPGDRRHGSHRRPVGGRTPPLAAVATQAPIVPPVCDVPDPPAPGGLLGCSVRGAIAADVTAAGSVSNAASTAPTIPDAVALQPERADEQPPRLPRLPIATFGSFRHHRALSEHSRRNVTQRQLA